MGIKTLYDTILKVITRIKKNNLVYSDQLSMVMDLEYSKIDLDKLLSFDDFNFGHDVSGIAKYFNRKTKSFDDCFVPRAGLIK